MGQKFRAITLFRISIKAVGLRAHLHTSSDPVERRASEAFPTQKGEMLKITLLLALGAVCAVHGARFEENRTADMEFLHKQKKIYDLLLYVNQGDLIDAEFYDIGRNYNLESNMDMYNDKVTISAS